ncbi:MAG: YkvA family protein [Leptospira sp.]|nr:YkvA family protein [Leptospira sp.]
MQEKETFIKNNFWKKIKETGAKLPFVNDVIAMYYCLLDEKTSLSAKASIVFALLYFITPIDVIPDFILALGYTDDATVIASTILLLKSQLKTEHYEKAKASLEKE